MISLIVFLKDAFVHMFLYRVSSLIVSYFTKHIFLLLGKGKTSNDSEIMRLEKVKRAD